MRILHGKCCKILLLFSPRIIEVLRLHVCLYNIKSKRFLYSGWKPQRHIKPIRISQKYNYFQRKYIPFDDSSGQRPNKTRSISKNKAIYGTIDPGRKDSSCQSVENVKTWGSKDTPTVQVLQLDPLISLLLCVDAWIRKWYEAEILQFQPVLQC